MKALVIYRTILYDDGVVNEQKLTHKNKSKKVHLQILERWFI